MQTKQPHDTALYALLHENAALSKNGCCRTMSCRNIQWLHPKTDEDTGLVCNCMVKCAAGKSTHSNTPKKENDTALFKLP